MQSTTSSTTPKTKRLFGPDFKAIPKAGSEAGLALKEEAITHLQHRRWKDAIRVSLAAQTLRAHDVDLHAVIAVASANSRKHGMAEHAVEALRFIIADKTRSNDERANGLIAIASVRLAQGRYTEADTEARKALAFDSTHEGAWWHLTAGFVGLGWFEQANDCLPADETLDEAADAAPSAGLQQRTVQPAASTGSGHRNKTDSDGSDSSSTDSSSTDSSITDSSITDSRQPYDLEADASNDFATSGGEHTTEDAPAISFAEWQVGRAINAWAMNRTGAWIVVAAGVVYFGLLGLAIAACTPFVVRELRVMRLDRQWRDMAEAAWRTEHKLRIGHALLTLVLLGAWVGALALAN